jgi:L-amino acid N-acyltransferase YncA
MNGIGEMQNYVINTMHQSDWLEVKQIYLDGIATGHATFEKEAPGWESWNDAHLAYARLVARAGDDVKGWAALSPVSSRCVYAGVAETSVYVAGDSRGQGIGRALLEALIHEAESNGVWTLQAAMFPENSGSIELHKALGFREVGRHERIGRLNGVWRDTLLLERRSATVGID